jgi:hypothetical protein
VFERHIGSGQTEKSKTGAEQSQDVEMMIFYILLFGVLYLA